MITQVSSASTASVSILTPNSGIRELVTSCNLLPGSLGQASYARVEEILHLWLAERVCAPNHTLSPIIASPATTRFSSESPPLPLALCEHLRRRESAVPPCYLAFPFHFVSLEL
jgi:hypothetical protein